MRLKRFVGLVAVALAVAACAGTPSAAKGMIVGGFFLVGGPKPGATYGSAGEVQVFEGPVAKVLVEPGGGRKAIPRGRLVVSEQVAKSQEFHFSVVPGVYLVCTQSCSGFQQVRVVGGKTVRVRFGTSIS
ncbi:MAG: hypothetical protein ABSD78_18845 [Acidimicrobiales bacterium]|jgi:hypothetical protein